MQYLWVSTQAGGERKERMVEREGGRRGSESKREREEGQKKWKKSESDGERNYVFVHVSATRNTCT